MATNSSKSTALTKVKANLPVNAAAFASELANLQKRLAAPSGDRITVTQAKTFKLQNGLEVPEIECVIVEFIAANFYYPGVFDRAHITPPACFALGLEPAGLVPSENSPDKQSESCAACWANQFKTAPNGKGKACGNSRLLALITLDADAESPISILKASSTALQSFDGYVASIATKFGVPVRHVHTKISMSDQEYASIRFSMIGTKPMDLKDPLLALAYELKEPAMKRLMTEPDVTPAQAEVPLRRAPAKKTLLRK